MYLKQIFSRELVFVFFLLSSSVIYCDFSLVGLPKIQFELSNAPIDVVIPTAKKDLSALERCIEGIKHNGKNIQRVIVISKEKYTDNAEWFDESLFPFTKEDIAVLLVRNQDKLKAYKYLKRPENRAGWLIQQLYKFYASFVIPDISENILVLDSDTIFFRPTSFVTAEGWPLFNVGTENHTPYFLHAKCLLPGLARQYKEFSGITHHMLFQKSVIEELFQKVEALHNCPFWIAFIRCISPDQIFLSGASEYEIYFNYFLMRSSQYKIRKLLWKDGLFRELEKDRVAGYDYVSCHDWGQ